MNKFSINSRIRFIGNQKPPCLFHGDAHSNNLIIEPIKDSNSKFQIELLCHNTNSFLDAQTNLYRLKTLDFKINLTTKHVPAKSIEYYWDDLVINQ